MADKVKTVAWTSAELPDFRGKKAYVLPGAFFSSVVTLMAEAGFERADNVKDADVVVFTGGADISPSLYDDKPVRTYGVNPQRDDFEKVIYHQAQKLGKVCFGICRGAQLLHAMNDGKLWQDVTHHGGSDHVIVDLDEFVTVKANSIHHQMCIENDTMDVIAVCQSQVSQRFLSADQSLDLSDGFEFAVMEVEAGAYSSTKCFFVQGHPEIGSPEYRSWTMTKLHDFYMEWTVGTRPIVEIIEGMGSVK